MKQCYIIGIQIAKKTQYNVDCWYEKKNSWTNELSGIFALEDRRNSVLVTFDDSISKDFRTVKFNIFFILYFLFYSLEQPAPDFWICSWKTGITVKCFTASLFVPVHLTVFELRFYQWYKNVFNCHFIWLRSSEMYRKTSPGWRSPALIYSQANT